MGFLAGPDDGVLNERTAGAISAFERARGLPVSSEASRALLDRVREARGEEFTNFLGCRTETSTRTVYVEQEVPVTREEPSREEDYVTYEVDGACNPAVICVGINAFGVLAQATYWECEERCRTGIANLIVQAPELVLGTIGVSGHLERACRRLAREQSRYVSGTAAALLDEVTVTSCDCPVNGVGFCSCELETGCVYETRERVTDYETRRVPRTVTDEREVCECLAPEVAGRECVRPGG